MANPIVIKVGGHEIEDPAFLTELAHTINNLLVPAIIVHGGGKEISDMQQRLGIEPRYIDGVRVTDAESLAIVEMMLCGVINKRVVRYLVAAGIEAQGTSGVDRGIVRAHKMPHPTVDMGFTGEVESVRGDVLLELLNSGVTPVIAPISLGPDSAYNVNADHVAGAVAAAVGALRVMFITNVEGVLVNGEHQPVLTAEQAEALISDGTIFGGMIPKVRTALGALESGVPQAAITNLAGFNKHGGTIFTKASEWWGEAKQSETADAPTGSKGDKQMIATSDLTTSIFDAEHTYIAQTYARAPFVLARGEGVTLYDVDGNAYEDWVAGIAVNALGYGDPELTQAIQEAAAGLIHASNLYLTPPQVELAQMLCEKSFADRVFFCNSGTEANEGAIKFARRLQYERGLTDKTEVVCFTGAFHGRTIGTLSLTPREKYQKPFKPLMPGVVVAEFNDIASAEAAIGANTAAVFVEPVQGEGGINAAAPEFLSALRDICDKHGAVLVFDEIQCGVGRTGTLWAHEAYGITPDIMTLAKPLAGGLPIGAILMTEEVASAMHAGDHGSTFSAGPLVMSAAKVVLTRISRPEFLGHVNEVGEYLMERLSEINSPLIKEVRGRGLIVGLEVDADAAALVKAGYERGIIITVAGPNVLRFVPPLVTEKHNVDNLAEKLTAILAEVGAGK